MECDSFFSNVAVPFGLPRESRMAYVREYSLCTVRTQRLEPRGDSIDRRRARIKSPRSTNTGCTYTPVV